MELRREVQVLIRRGMLTDRQALVSVLERETGITAVYTGAPSFRYIIGDYIVLRDGCLEVQDGKENRALLSRLASEGLIEDASDEPSRIASRTDSFTGRTLVNIVNMLASKGRLLNKVIGRPNAIHMSAELVRELKEENPNIASEFMDVLHRCGGDKAIRGLRLTGGEIIFTGFPDNDTYRVLAEHMVNTAQSHRWIKAEEPPSENEKYTFRVWLNTLGMKGPEYAAERAELLKNLTGDSAFRTEEQRAAFCASRRKGPVEPEFIVL